MATTTTTITRTFYGAELQTAQLLGIPYVTDAKGTLNARFNVLPNEVMPDDKYPSLVGFTIGFGGHDHTTGTDGTPLTSEKPHLMTDVANYKPLPFVARNINDDLTPQEKAKYGIRVLFSGNDSNTYALYYVRLINKTGVTTKKEIHTKNSDGTTTISAFTPGDENLVPVAPELSSEGINVLAAKDGVVTAPITLHLTKQEIREIIDAALVLYGDDRYAQISEIGMITGLFKNITLANQEVFREIVFAQTAAFAAAAYQLRHITTEFTAVFDSGVSGPLLKVVTA